MHAALDLSEVLSTAPRECWIALDENAHKIVGKGETIEQALNEAKKAGADDPMVIWSPTKWIPLAMQEGAL